MTKRSQFLAAVAAVLSIFTLAAQAETETPDILSSVSPAAVQVMSKSEASKTRGEYRYCTRGFPSYCGTTFSRTEPHSTRFTYVVWKYRVPGFGYWVSR